MIKCLLQTTYENQPFFTPYLARIFKHSAYKKLCSRDNDLALLEDTLEAFLGGR